eukprot:TRINITY_DN156668_c0_g1_i1.p1 TRINITY_DN156668_c0_g1~~TRINITY_DN156668_c0_g1_i1.p1  ORF type:complete len:286 (+),score=21.49 TRINITY_DN156668_c0_g1_i1:48-905(+)
MAQSPQFIFSPCSSAPGLSLPTAQQQQSSSHRVRRRSVPCTAPLRLDSVHGSQREVGPASARLWRRQEDQLLIGGEVEEVASPTKKVHLVPSLIVGVACLLFFSIIIQQHRETARKLATISSIVAAEFPDKFESSESARSSRVVDFSFPSTSRLVVLPPSAPIVVLFRYAVSLPSFLVAVVVFLVKPIVSGLVQGIARLVASALGTVLLAFVVFKYLERDSTYSPLVIVSRLRKSYNESAASLGERLAKKLSSSTIEAQVVENEQETNKAAELSTEKDEEKRKDD